MDALRNFTAVFVFFTTGGYYFTTEVHGGFKRRDTEGVFFFTTEVHRGAQR